MHYFRSLFMCLLIFSTLLFSQKKASAQHPEVGIKVVLSGALMFGPYFTYWVDDHNALNSSILAAYEGKLIVPFAVNAGYSVHFFNNKWRPEIGLQYSYLISPIRHKSERDPNGISILSLVPGVQFQWENSHQNIGSRIWLAYIFDRPKKEKIKILPIGLDFSYGHKFY